MPVLFMPGAALQQQGQMLIGFLQVGLVRLGMMG